MGQQTSWTSPDFPGTHPIFMLWCECTENIRLSRSSANNSGTLTGYTNSRSWMVAWREALVESWRRYSKPLWPCIGPSVLAKRLRSFFRADKTWSIFRWWVFSRSWTKGWLPCQQCRNSIIRSAHQQPDKSRQCNAWFVSFTSLTPPKLLDFCLYISLSHHKLHSARPLHQIIGKCSIHSPSAFQNLFCYWRNMVVKSGWQDCFDFCSKKKQLVFVNGIRWTEAQVSSAQHGVLGSRRCYVTKSVALTIHEGSPPSNMSPIEYFLAMFPSFHL